MAAIFHGKHILFSRPRYDSKLVAWRAYASVSWNGAEFAYHKLDLEEIFQTEKEALAFGYAACRTWVDERA